MNKASGHGAAAVEQCIEHCLHCHRTCLQEAMTHCLAVGGAHVEQNHLRLMLNCAELCQVSANFMISGNPLHGVVCAACAEICAHCADSCGEIEGMEACAGVCRRCAEHCRAMAA
jgi:hypothetical protein